MNLHPLGVQEPAGNYGFPFLSIDAGKVLAITEYLMSRGVPYEMGAKAPSLDCDYDDIDSIDCSGLARLLVYRATAVKGQAVTMPDGSVNQRVWCEQVGFKLSTAIRGQLHDGAVRIAFLTPEDAVAAGMGAGERHVMLIVDGFTCESHGGKGPDRRAWLSERWMGFCQVYVLGQPSNQAFVGQAVGA